MSPPESSQSTAATIACTVSRDVQGFDLLIEDMEAVLGAGWGDLGFAEALGFFDQPGARQLEFIALPSTRRMKRICRFLKTSSHKRARMTSR